MRTLVIVGLIAGAVAVLAPDQGAELMRSVVHGFGWGIGREVAHSVWSSSLVRRVGQRLSIAESSSAVRPR